MTTVWVFNGVRDHFPSGVFSQRELAEAWIRKYKLTGTLTAYPIDQGVYDWAIEYGHFKQKREEHNTPSFIGNFNSPSQENYHYQDGALY